MKQKNYILLFLFLSIVVPVLGQSTKLRGKVTDSQTKEVLPFVTVHFTKTSIGTITDFNGEYFLETREKVDSVMISCIGYKTITRPIVKRSFQTIDIQLESSNTNLPEIVVHAGENPAHILLRKIVANKENNNPEKIEAYQYEVYNKMEIDVNNIDAKYREKKIFKHFQFIFDYMDTSAVTGKNFLPIFISETFSDYYYRKKPKADKEVIKANKISGMENKSITQFTGQIYQKINVYDNYMEIFSKPFVSPIASFGLLSYEYYLVDSAVEEHHKIYHVTFKPRRKQELTFTGEFWVHDSTFAIKKAVLRIAKDANINFVNDLVLEHEFKHVNDQYWMLSKESIFVDFNLSDSTTGFFARRSTSYRNFVLNQPHDDKFYDRATGHAIEVKDDALQKNDDYWDNMRPDSLSKRELGIYKMIDTIQEVPVYKTYVDIITLIVSGYKEFKYFDIGPYPTMYSYNLIEGSRFRFGGRTSVNVSENIFFNGYIAYGIKDNAFKYAVGSSYYFNKSPERLAQISYKDDLEQFGKDPNTLISTDNILGSIFSRTVATKLNRVREFDASYEHEWFPGFANTLTLKRRKIFTYGTSDIMPKLFDTLPAPNIKTSEFVLNTRFAYDEKFIVGKRDRTSIGTDFPILQANFVLGIKGLLKGDFNYQKMSFSIDHDLNINPFGHTFYTFEYGKVFGQLPFYLLKMHEGNETYWYNNAFNLMNYYEFVSDEYLSFKITHHFDGLFFNKIPLLRKLKLREVVAINGVFGSLRTENDSIHTILKPFEYGLGWFSKQQKSYFGVHLPKPYYELSAGVENILSIIRIDALWRMSYIDPTYVKEHGVSTFGIRATLQLRF